MTLDELSVFVGMPSTEECWVHDVGAARPDAIPHGLAARDDTVSIGNGQCDAIAHGHADAHSDARSDVTQAPAFFEAEPSEGGARQRSQSVPEIRSF